MAEQHPKSRASLGELAGLFLKLGTIGFGGPAAHIAMMEEETVTRRGWISRDRFLDLVGVTSLIPGPNSTEMAIHLGFLQAGWRGLVIAGACFIVPAVSITTLFAWAYFHFGALPLVAPFLFGIKPAVLAVILGAIWRLGQRAMKGWRLGLLGIAVALISLTEFNSVLALFGGGLLGMFWIRVADKYGSSGGVAASLAGPGAIMALPALGGGSAWGVSLWTLGAFFFKVGAVLYGSGYVLVAFLEEDLVHKYGWLTQEQLLEAIAIGQFTPGPVLSTAAFIGFLVTNGSFLGAIVAAGAISLPSFVFVALLNPVLPRLRESEWMSAFLDAVNVSAVGLMAGVTVKLSYAILGSWPAMGIAGVAAVLGLWRNMSAVWLILGGAFAGGIWMLLGG